MSFKRNSLKSPPSIFTFETSESTTSTSSTKTPKVPKTQLLSPRFWNTTEQKKELVNVQTIKELDEEVER